jgi:outer membrane protein OmpA-like peptidoglycan-associated protein
VKAYLVKAGIAADRLTTKGVGATELVHARAEQVKRASTDQSSAP